MKFVATKMADQLDLQCLHRVRDRLVSQRTGVTFVQRGRRSALTPLAAEVRTAEMGKNCSSRNEMRPPGYNGTVPQGYIHIPSPGSIQRPIRACGEGLIDDALGRGVHASVFAWSTAPATDRAMRKGNFISLARLPLQLSGRRSLLNSTPG